MTFREWMGVIAMIYATMSTGLLHLYLAVRHMGGVRKIISDFMGTAAPLTDVERQQFAQAQATIADNKRYMKDFATEHAGLLAEVAELKSKLAAVNPPTES